MVLVLTISLADPVSRLLRLELRVQGKEEETILDAKKTALDSERIQTAMQRRAETEAEALAVRVEGVTTYVDPLPSNGHGLNGHPVAVFANKSNAYALPTAEIETVDDIDRILTGRVTRNSPPKLGGGYFFRENGKGWELRRNVYDENSKRKQPHIAHLSSSKWAEMKQQNRTERELKTALREWLFDAVSGQ
jgi:hypothetical protein